MHRTYSMRQSRAPTQAEVLNPPPPPSSTKSGRLFGRNNFAYPGHAFRKTAAGAFGPDLAKKLSQLVKMEKNVMRSMELVSRERREVARQLSVWGEECDEDVSDITDKLGVLIYEIGELEDQFIDRYDQYRVTMKSIRNIEASVQPSRDRKQKITDQIAQLKYKDPNSPKIVVLEQELVRAEAESLVAEAQLSNITREKLKSAFAYQFDALQEHCEKVAMIAGYGKHMLQLIDDTPVTPGETREAYDGYEASKSIIQDCEQALTNWVPARAAVKPRLSVRSRSKSAARRSARMREEDEEELYADGRLHSSHHPAHHHHHLHREHDADVSPPGSRGERRSGVRTANGVTLNAPAETSAAHGTSGSYEGERVLTSDVGGGGRFYKHGPHVATDTTTGMGQVERGEELSKELGVPVAKESAEGRGVYDREGRTQSGEEERPKESYDERPRERPGEHPELVEKSSYERLPREPRDVTGEEKLIERESERMNA